MPFVNFKKFAQLLTVHTVAQAAITLARHRQQRQHCVHCGRHFLT